MDNSYVKDYQHTKPELLDLTNKAIAFYTIVAMAACKEGYTHFYRMKRGRWVGLLETKIKKFEFL